MKLSLPSSSRFCPACGEQRPFCLVRRLRQPGEKLALEVEECERCQLVHLRQAMDEQTLLEYSLAFGEAMESGAGGKGPEKALRQARVRARGFSHLPAGRVLDIGCGPAYFLAAMQELGWTAHGIEPNPGAAERASQRLSSPIHAGPLETFESAAPFELISMWHVFEHLDDPSDGLRRCAALLAPGGRVFFEVPFIDSLEAAAAGAYWMGYRNPTHHWMYRERSLRLLAERAGLAVERLGPVRSGAGWYGLKRGLKGRMLQRDFYQDRLQGSKVRASLWRRAAAGLLGWYPVDRALDLAAGLLGRGDVLHGWFRKP